MEKSKSNITTRELILTALSIALITLGAYIKITLFVVPFTLQLLMVMIIALTFGYKVGFLSTSIYTIMGLVGLPVFSSGGGLGYIASPGFGYILGFVLAAFIIGFLAGGDKISGSQKTVLLKTFSVTLIALMLVYLMGISYWYLLGHFFVPKFKMEIFDLVYKGAIIFMPKDLFLCFVASVVAPKLKLLIKR